MRLAILAATILTTAALAPAASAGTVCESAGVATFAAADVASACPTGSNGASEVNSLTVTTDASGAVVFTDTNPMTDGDGPGGCTVSGNTGTCPGALSATFNLGAGDDTATIGAVPSGGTDFGGAGADRITGGPFGDVIDGGAGADTIDGGAGDDTISGGSENDSLSGGAGNDVLSGGDGNDSLSGGAGNDQLFGDAGDDTESGGDDQDQLDGGATPGCPGSAGSDILSGDGGDDQLCGGAGPAGGKDADVLNGGEGEDTAYYLRSANVNVSLDDVANDGEAGEGDNVHSDVEDITSGSGADTLTGSDARNVLDGGAGPDVLNGLGGNDVLTDSGGDTAADRLDGGPGDDTLSAGLGPDTYIGGDGEDAVVDYANRAVPVTVTLDGVANDGAAGEGDNVEPDVEDVTGGSGNDTLVGNDSDNQLDGGAGDDTISGGGGNDGLIGGPGRDVIDGGSGRDLLSGGSGADTLQTRDGQTDRAECGGGTDTVQGEARDDISGDCENVSLLAPSALAIRKVQVTRAGFVIVTLGCPAAEQVCSGLLYVKTVRRLSGRFVQLGRVGYRLRGGLTRATRARIGANDRRTLRRAGRVKVRVIVTNVNSDTGQSTNATKLATVTTRGL